MNSSEELWDFCKDHVKTKIHEAIDEMQMLNFIDLMIAHFKQHGQTEPVLNGLKRQMVQTMIVEISLRIQQQKRQAEITKREIYDPEQEQCLVAHRHDMVKIEKIIRNRNALLVKPIPYRLIK